MEAQPQGGLRVRLTHPKLSHTIHCFASKAPLHHLAAVLPSKSLLQLFTNYHYAHQGSPIYSTRDLREAQSSSKGDILEFDVVFESYNLATATHHFRKINQLLKRPLQLSELVKPGIKQSSDIEKGDLDQWLLPQDFRENSWNLEGLREGIWSIQQVTSPNYDSRFYRNTHRGHDLVNFLEWSGFNPPLPQAQFAGDLFYLHLRTLQNADLHITACSSGFYLNQSKINAFNSHIQPGKNIYTSLLDLLAASSQKFSTALARNTEINQTTVQALSRKDRHLRPPQRTQTHWLDTAQSQHSWNCRKQSTFRDLQCPLQVQKDWNSAFLQVEKEVEAMRLEGKMQQARKWEHLELGRLYEQFSRAAVEGARRLVEGKMHSINHMEESFKHIYIHNKIFFSVTQDNPYHRSIEKTEDCQVPSSAAANTELHNLQTLAQLHVPQVRLLHTAMVRYRGIKVIGQTVIPGLLSAELNSITQYGSVDQGKSIQVNEHFHKLIMPLCEHLHLDGDIQAVEEKGRVVNIAISPDIKGIRSTDGQYYLCDLQKFSPRDLNYPGVQNETCVLRQTLIKSYAKDHPSFKQGPTLNVNIATQIKFQQSSHHAQQQALLLQMAAYLKQVAVPKVTAALKSKNAGDYMTDSKGISSLFHKYGVNMRYLGLVQRHEQLSDCIEVRTFLCRAMLVRSIKHLLRQVLKQTEQTQLSQVLSHVLNCLFGPLSAIILLNKTQIREQFPSQTVQSKKKKKKKARQEEKQGKTGTQQEAKVIKLKISNYLSMRSQTLWDEVRAIAKARFDFNLQQNVVTFHEKGLFSLPYQKYAALRDVCLCTGLVIQRKQYNLWEFKEKQGVSMQYKTKQKQGFPFQHKSKEKESTREKEGTRDKENLPFQPRNILYFVPMVKTISVAESNSLLQLVAQADSYFNTNNIIDALRVYKQAVNLIRQNNQGQALLNYCLSQTAHLHYMMGSIREALSVASENLCFSCRVYGQDSLEVIRCYSRLGLYCMGTTTWRLSLWLLSKSLHLMLMCFGQNYPQILVSVANIGRVLSDMGNEPQLAISCYLRAIDILARVYRSKQHVNISICYSSLASLHYSLQQLKRSVQYQQQAVSILQKVLSNEDSRCQDAQKILKGYRDILQSSRNHTNTPKERKK